MANGFVNTDGSVGSSDMGATKLDYYAQGAGGLADLGLGIYNIYQGNKAAKQAKADLATAMANRPDLSPSTAFADAERQAYSKKMLNMQRQSLQRNLAQGVSAASADPRVLAASLQGMQRQAAMGEQQAMQAQAQQQMQATMARGRAEQQATQMMEARSQGDIQRESQNLASARQAIGQGVGQIAGGIGSIAGTVAGIRGMKDGGTIKKTPGEFSHKSNPIDIMRNGDKIGEMTGGEYIFNPTQVEKIKGHVSSGNKEQLHKYMKTLIKKFEK